MAKLYPGIYSPWLSNYKDIRNLYASMHRTAQIAGRPLTAEDYAEIRRSARVVYRRPVHDPLLHPLTSAWRTRYDGDGETGIDYRILPEDPDHPMTDDEIEEYMHDSDVYYGRGFHDFDCSGDRFTWSWSYTRTPAGVVLIHHWTIDI